ncbi:MAG: hypothetical protein ACR2KQ_11490, partial [Actinomycetota bacterium]
WSVTLSSSGAVTWFRPSGRVCDPGPPLPSPGEVARGTPPRDPPRPIEVRRYSRLLGAAALF